jgi:hypothetical protein
VPVDAPSQIVPEKAPKQTFGAKARTIFKTFTTK